MKLKHLLILFGLLVISASLTPFGKVFEVICYFLGAALIVWLLVGAAKYFLK